MDLVFVRDVSKSMEGTKLKRAMAMVVRSMGCVDSLSIVTFFAIAKRMIGDGKQVAMEVVNALACMKVFVKVQRF